MTLNSKSANSLFFSYTLMTGVYFLFFVNIRYITLNGNKSTITQFQKFSDFFKYEKILSALNVLDDLVVDDGFPINDYLSINPLSLTVNKQNKNKKLISWYIVWFFLTGQSIRRIANSNNLNKKNEDAALKQEKAHVEAALKHKQALAQSTEAPESEAHAAWRQYNAWKGNQPFAVVHAFEQEMKAHYPNVQGQVCYLYYVKHLPDD